MLSALVSYKPEGLVPCSQQAPTGSSSQSDEFRPHFPSNFFNVYFDIIQTFMPRSFNWSLSFRFCYKIFVCISYFSTYLPCMLHAMQTASTPQYSETFKEALQFPG
jgi:hypothetical protein